MSKKKQTENTRQKAKTHELSGMNSLSPFIASENILLSFFYQIRLTSLDGISVVALFVNQPTTCS